jgi:hypothetical protein
MIVSGCVCVCVGRMGVLLLVVGAIETDAA